MVYNNAAMLVPTEPTCAASEDKALCIVRDMTDAQSQQKHTFNLPATFTCARLLGDVAARLGYQDDSFLLTYEQPKGDETEEIVLNDVSGLRLEEVCVNCGNGRRNTFLVMEKDGLAPVRVHTPAPPGGDEAETSLDAVTCGAPSSQLTVGTATDDSPGAQNSGTQTYGPTLSSASSGYGYNYQAGLIKSDTGYVGLVNQAMTCYLNSLLQTLFMTPEFRNAVYRWEFDGSEEEASKSIPYQLQKLFVQQQTTKRRAVETTDITKSFGWDSSEAWQQHDVQELCRVMFDALERKWKNTDQANLINQLYQGKMKDYVKCLQCGCESARTDTFLDVPLVIRPFGSTSAYESVEQALNAFVEPEILDDNNKYHCERCDAKCTAHKGLKFLEFPYLLTMQLKRFDFDYVSLHRIKLNDRVTFPEILNLNHLTESSPEGATAQPGDGHHGNGAVDGSGDKVTERQSDQSPGAASAGEGVDEGVDIAHSASGTSAASDASDVSRTEAAANDRNAQQSTATGPYEYELFSIMIHSGSAAGGHYYAYIKSFEDGQWYSFNDQHVSTITYDDIKKTYGGSTASRAYYSSAYTSSTNAYMLMYRQIDKERNKAFITEAEFPQHLKDSLRLMKEREEAERLQREMDRNMCKIRLFCFHPEHAKLLESRLEINKDRTLDEATEVAWRQFELEQLVPLASVRLVKYDETLDYIDQSYGGREEQPMGALLGGVKTFYTYELLLEVKAPDQEFLDYKPGGVTVKVHLVDLSAETLGPPLTVRAYLTQTIDEFLSAVSLVTRRPKDTVRCVRERYYNDLRLLTTPHRTLKAEGFTKSNKVFVEYSGSEQDVIFPESRLYRLLDRYENTIRLHIVLPPFVQDQTEYPPVVTNHTPDTTDQSAGSAVPERGEPDGEQSGSTDREQSGSTDTQGPEARPSVPPEEESWEEAPSTPEWERPVDEECRRYLTAHLHVNTQSGERDLTVCVDKRITLGALKKELESYVGTTANYFKVYRVYSNSQEVEVTRLTETLSTYSDDSKLAVKLGRALKKGEYRVKIYQLMVTQEEVSKFLLEAIFARGMTVLESKQIVQRELKAKCDMDVSVDRCRLRKKSWKNPSRIYHDSQVYDRDITIMTNCELFLEILDGPETVVSPGQLSLYARRWRSSLFSVDPLQEVVLREQTVTELRERISAVSGIQEEEVEYAKAKGTFPCETSLLEIHSEMDWTSAVTSLNMYPLSVCEDGAVLYYRDKTEKLMELSAERKKELQQQESSRLSGYTSRIHYSPRKERALKIYTDDGPSTTTTTTTTNSSTTASTAQADLD